MRQQMIQITASVATASELLRVWDVCPDPPVPLPSLHYPGRAMKVKQKLCVLGGCGDVPWVQGDWKVHGVARQLAAPRQGCLTEGPDWRLLSAGGSLPVCHAVSRRWGRRWKAPTSVPIFLS